MLVPVAALGRGVVEVGHAHVAALDVVVVDDEDAVDRADAGRERVDRQVDHFRRIEEVPRQDDHGDDRGDQAAGAPRDVLREDVRDVERSRDEVRDDIDAHGGDEHREAEDEDGDLVVEVAHHLDRVDDHLAEHGGRARNRDDRDEREEDEVDRQTPEVAAAHVGSRAGVAREVAEVEGRAAEVGDDERGADDHFPSGFSRREGLVGKREADVVPAGFVDDHRHEHEHGGVDQGARPVHEAADGVHVAEEERRLEEPHRAEAVPAEFGEAEVGAFSKVSEVREEVEHHDHERGAGEVGLNAVPDDGDDAADERGNVRAEDAVSHAGDDREGNAVALAGHADDVGEALNDDDADDERQEDLPAGEAEREERACEDVAAGTVHVAHPEGEDVVPGPCLLSGQQVRIGENAATHFRWYRR